MSELTLIIEALSDGKWHSKETLEADLKLQELNVERIIDFLKANNLIQENSKGQLKYSNGFQKLACSLQT